MATPQQSLAQIDRWLSGLYTNRSPIHTPFKFSYGRSILFHDALIDGSNMEITPQNTLARRPGWTKYCSVTYGTDVPKALVSCDLNSVIYNLLDTDQKIYSFTPSALTPIYTKTTTNQTFFQQVGNYLFMSDGAVNQKWDGVSLTNNGVTNNGVVAPTTAPTISNLNWYDSGGASQTLHAWIPDYVYANTTGSPKNFYFVAPTGEVQWAVVPAGTTLKSQSSAPNWATNFGVFGSTTVDGTMSWINCGSVGSWKASTSFANGAFYLNHQVASSGPVVAFTTSGTTTPAPNMWDVSNVSQAVCFGAGDAPGNSNTLIATGFGLSVPVGATITGVTLTLYKNCNKWNKISDITVQLLKAGVGSGSNKALGGFWPATTTWGAPNFTSQATRVVYGSPNDMWGTTLTPTDVANSGFGFQLVAHEVGGGALIGLDNARCTLTVSYKVALSDISGQVYAQIIQDSSGNLQRVKTSGTSGGSAPAWSATVGGTTSDGSVTWECLGTANQLAASFSWNYAYGFHTSSGHISNMSPALTISAPIVGNGIPLQGSGSDDAQVDRCDIYRTADGGNLFLFDQSVPNVNSSTLWTVTDSTLDSALNLLLIGPVALANNPPPTGMTLLAYHMGRLWGAVGNLLYFSGGPDTVNGDGMQAWPPANVFTISAPITGLGATSQGLVVYTGIDVSVVLGGPQAQTFWVQPLLKNLGIQSPNCLTQDGDDMVLYSSQQQMTAISAAGRNELGLVVAPTLQSNFTATGSYVAIHRAGQDQGLFISDGSSKVMRYNMNAEAWDPIGTAVNGIGPLASVDTAIGTRRLLSTAGGYIVFRDTSTFSDAGSAFSGYATIGSIVLAPAGAPVAKVQNIAVHSAAVGAALTIGVLPNEVSGSFTNIPLSNSDPWQLPASSTINMKMYQWLGVQSALAAIVKHLQIKITLPTEAAHNEIYSLTIL